MIVNYDRLRTDILLKNPGGRICKIGFAESGWYREQVFTSEELPDKIPYEFIGLVKFPDGAVRPKYRAKVVTKSELHLSGRNGIRNGVDIMNRICHELCYQDGFFDATSIKKSDLKKLGDEKFSYWIASSTSDSILSVENLGESIPVFGAASSDNNSMVFSHDLCNDTAFPVRPVITLEIEVSVHQNTIVPWVSL